MITLTLENFVFDHLEIPEKIAGLGGEQLEYTHKLPGGVRVVNAMGPDDAPIEWTGMFDGLTAVLRARYLDNLRRAGKAVKCTWGPYSYMVLIKKFTYDYQFLPIPYNISLLVIQDLTNPLTLLAPSSFDDAILAAASELLTLASLVEFGGVLGAIAALYAAINAIPSISDATVAQLSSIVALVNSASAITGTAIAATNSGIFG